MHPSPGAIMQPWEVVVEDDREVKEKINKILLNSIGEMTTSKGFINAPVYIILYGDNRTRSYSSHNERNNDSWRDFIFNASLNKFMHSPRICVWSEIYLQ